MASSGRRSSRDHGFTLVELLVVVTIIGILIAIAIPLYLRFEQGAYEATAKSDLRLMRLEEQSYNAAQSTFGTTRQLATANPAVKLSKSGIGAVVWSSADGFCVGATNTKAPEDRNAPFAAFGYAFKTYFYDSTTGTVSTTLCPTPGGATGIDNTYIDETGLH